MYNRVNCKLTAKDCLRGNWSFMAGLTVLFGIFTGTASFIGVLIPIIGWIFTAGVTPCVAFAQLFISKKLYNNEPVHVSDMFSGFPLFLKCLGLQLWIGLWIMLWSFLFVIPGIIKSFSYSMAIYRLMENPELSIRETLNESKRLTNGRKFDLFILGLSFIGWSILAILTCGFGLLFLYPYINMTMYCAYKTIQEEKDGVTQSDTMDSNTTEGY